MGCCVALVRLEGRRVLDGSVADVRRLSQRGGVAGDQQAAGVTPAQFQTVLEQGTLLKRLPTLAEVADTAAFIASDHAGAMTATVVNVSAGNITD